MKTYKPLAGEHIAEACEKAAALMQETREMVRFCHNDIEIVTKPNSTGQSLLQDWEHQSEAAAKKWRESPEYREQEMAWAKKLSGYQATVDSRMKHLPKVIQNHHIRPLILWLKTFGEAAGYSGIEYDKTALIEQLEAAGYREGEFVGEKERIDADPNVKARYIVGQFLSCLKEIGCWPDILPSWCDDWAKENR